MMYYRLLGEDYVKRQDAELEIKALKARIKELEDKHERLEKKISIDDIATINRIDELGAETNG